MMSQSYDIDLDCVLDSVLDDIDHMMMSDTYIPPVPSSPIYNYYPTVNPNCTNSWIQNVQAVASSTNSAISPINSERNCFMNGSSIITRFKPENSDKVELKDHVFISKDCTYRLGQYTVKENWGKDGVLLYKYLDYIFRCQLFDEEIIKVHEMNGAEFLVFHTGLKRRSDHEYLFVLLFPNFISKTHKNKQKWRVQFGNIYDSFLSKDELLQKLCESDVIDLCIPKRTVFCSLNTDAVYNPMYKVKVSWEERLITNTDRIYKVIGIDAFFDKSRKHLKLTQLINAFDEALNNSKRMLLRNPKLAIPQGFVDTKRKKYRMELLLPLTVYFDGVWYSFALAIAPSSDGRQSYTVKSVLTLNMAYNNARLVGAIDSLWLRND